MNENLDEIDFNKYNEDVKFNCLFNEFKSLDKELLITALFDNSIELITKYNNIIFKYIWNTKRLDLINLFIYDTRFDFNFDNGIILLKSYENKYMEIFEYLLTYINPNINLFLSYHEYRLSNLLSEICKIYIFDKSVEYFSMIKSLFKMDILETSVNNNDALMLCCINNEIELVNLILSHKNTKFDPKMDISFILHLIRIGNIDIEIFKLLFNFIDPSQLKNIVFVIACKYNNINLVKLLLIDNRVNPIDQYNRGYIEAYNNDNIDILTLLLEDNRVNIYDQNQGIYKIID